MRLNNIAALRHRLILEEPLTLDDGAGGFTRSYQTVTTLWGAIYPLRKKDDKLQDRATQLLTHIILIRCRSDLTRLHRLRHEGRVFHIRAIDNVDERAFFSEILVEEQRP
jgi:SPP1 family predicted phage head-tail adaptor